MASQRGSEFKINVLDYYKNILKSTLVFNDILKFKFL